MRIARVVGTVVSTIKDPRLHAVPLLLVQPLTTDLEPLGDPLVAVDAVGVGPGEEVLVVRGKEGAFLFATKDVPTDAGIAGKMDRVSTPEPRG